MSLHRSLTRGFLATTACLTGLALPAQVSQPASYLEALQLTGFDSNHADWFGVSVDAHDDILVVGAPFADAEGIEDRGSVYVFQKGPNGWEDATQIAKLFSSDGEPLDNFGRAVAIHDDTIVVGAIHWTNEGHMGLQGVVYVYQRPVGGWRNATQNAKLTADNSTDDDHFGVSVDVVDDLIVVGAEYADINGVIDAGAAYVFVKPQGGWANAFETARLTASDAITSDEMGYAVATDGTRVFAGARKADIGTANEQGTVYVYEPPEGGWVGMTESVKLTAADGSIGDRFGTSLAAQNNLLVIGAPADDGPAGLDYGAVYVFARNGANWAPGSTDQIAKLTGTDTEELDWFGWSVDLEGNIIAVGSRFARISGAKGYGAAYVYYRPISGWTNMTETEKIVGTGGRENDESGFSVAITDGMVASGARARAVNGLIDQGMTYVFDLVERYPSSGCGLGPINLFGSRRVGEWLSLSMNRCATGSVHSFAVGLPLPVPVNLTNFSCSQPTPCALSCNPVVTVPGPYLPLPLPNDPTLAGIPLCWQGICIEPAACLSTTEKIELAFTL